MAAMTSYPIHNPAYRETLNSNIYNYYRYYHISVKDKNKWLNLLSARMAVIMPRYNQIYASLDLEFDPLLTYDYNRTVKHVGQEDHTKDNTAKKDNDTTITTDKTSKTDTKDNTIDTGKTTEKRNTVSAETTSDHEGTTADGSMTNNGGYTTDRTDSATGSSTSQYSTMPQGNLNASPNTVDPDPYADNKTVGTSKDNNTGKDTNVHNDTTTTTNNTATDKSGKSDGTINLDGSGTADRTVDVTGTKNVTDHTGTDKVFGETSSANESFNKNNSYNDDIHEYGTAPGYNYSKLVEDYRALAVNIDYDIILELDDLFFTIFGTCDFDDCLDFIRNPWYNDVRPI